VDSVTDFEDADEVASQCATRDASGQIPDGETEVGFVQIDDIEFF